MMFDKLTVVGLGYIGLPTAAMFASKGINVSGFDINPEIVSLVGNGEIHIVEPDLDVLVNQVVQSGHLSTTTELEWSQVFVLAVPTPLDDQKKPNLKFLQEAVRLVASVLMPDNLIIIESTCPVGTTELVENWLKQLRPDLNFPSDRKTSSVKIAYCPERVLPGKILTEIVINDRIIGGLTGECAKLAKQVYSLFVKGELFLTDTRTAEMAKLTENSFRDVNIAFANELSLLCDKMKINIWDLLHLTNRHPRVNILKPGPGVGGHCIAVDPWFLVHDGEKDAKIIKAAREINDKKTIWVLDKILSAIEEHFNKENRMPLVACMGLAFKPDIDDLRESPALKIFYGLLDKGINVLPVEPNLKSHSSIKLASVEKALKEAELLVFLVAHEEFKSLEFNNQALDFCGVLESNSK